MTDSEPDDLTDEDNSNVSDPYSEYSDDDESKRFNDNEDYKNNAVDNSHTKALFNYRSVKKHQPNTIFKKRILDASVNVNSEPFNNIRKKDVKVEPSAKEIRALEFLLRYETMVRQQEAENMAVISHLKPCLERLQELILEEEEPTNSKNATSTFDVPINQISESFADTMNDDLQRTISFTDLKKGLDILDRKSQQKQVTPNSSGTETCVVPEFMLTDRQFMMVLRILTTSPVSCDRSDCTITWAEIIQCYKVCISGMIALEHLTSPPEQKINSGEGSNPQATNHIVNPARVRARDRTLTLLSLFKPNAFDNQPRTLATEDKESSSSNRDLEKSILLDSRNKFVVQRNVSIPSRIIVIFFLIIFLLFVNTIKFSHKRSIGSEQLAPIINNSRHILSNSNITSLRTNNDSTIQDKTIQLRIDQFNTNGIAPEAMNINTSSPVYIDLKGEVLSHNGDDTVNDSIDNSSKSISVDVEVPHLLASNRATYLQVARYTEQNHPFIESIIVPTLMMSVAVIVSIPNPVLAPVIFAPFSFFLGKVAWKWTRHFIASLRVNHHESFRRKTTNGQ